MYRFVMTLTIISLLAGAAAAQTPAPTPVATPEVYEPKADVSPDLNEFVEGRPQSYDEWAKIYFQVLRLLKTDTVLLPNGKVRALKPFSGRIFELVGEDGEFYLVRNLPLEDPDSHGHRNWRRMNTMDRFNQRRDEFYADKYLIGNLEDVFPPFTDKLEFVPRNQGLPAEGRFQTSLDIADMNGDGLPDLVVPPQRQGYPWPSIALQQKDGSWKQLTEVAWPKDLRVDYGAARVADFDLDGHPDIALACHFNRNYVFYGDGKGDFTRYVVLPRKNETVSSRALTVADFNNDGRPDLAMVAEINLDMGKYQRVDSGLVNVLLNLPGGWKVVSEGFPSQIQADWLTTGDIDGDGDADLLLTSTLLTIRELVWRNEGDGTRFSLLAADQLPPASYIFSNVAVPMDRFPYDDLVLCFEQFNPYRQEPPAQACGIFHFHDAEGTASATPTVDLFFKREEEYNNVIGVAAGDVDGDGRTDLAMMTTLGDLRVYLQFPDGELYQENGAELALPPETSPFDIKIADLDGDGRGEIVVMGAPQVQKGGGIWVFSPKPRQPATAS